MSRNLVDQVFRRCCCYGALGLLASLVAACAAEAASVQDSGDAQSAAAGSGAGTVAGNAAASSGAMAAAMPAAVSGGRGGAVAGPAAGSGVVSAAGSGGSAVAAAGSKAPQAAAGSAGAAGSLSVSAGAGAQALPMMGGAGTAGSAGMSGSAGTQDAAGAAAPGGAITIWLAGDSTVAKGNTPCPVGWGAEFQALFKPEAKVVNSAVGGRSVRTWLYEVQTQMDASGECALNKDSSGEPVLQARWQMMLDGMKSGDYLFIQFGINDSSASCDRHVGIEAFKESYGTMAEAAKMRGAQPVFVTPVSAISCQGSMARPTRGNFVTATIDAGKMYDVPVIDLHERSIALYNQQALCPIPGGSDVSASTGGKVGAFFCDDHTHFSAEGAAQIAELMAQALKDEMLGLAAYLR